jgi:hypothetical protein
MLDSTHMEALAGLVILIFVSGLILAGIVGLATRSRSHSPLPSTAVDPNWQPPKVDPLPYKKKNYIFSAAERSFYEVLVRLIPEYTVFAKIRLADLVYVQSDRAAFWSHFNRISAKHVDFAVCDKDLAPILVIELDDSSHEAEKRKTREEFVDQVLSAAAVPIVRVPARRGYVLEDIRKLIRIHLPPPTY